MGKRGEATTVDERAREMCIPKTFLAEILQKLTKAGLVTSRKGVKGDLNSPKGQRRSVFAMSLSR